MAHNQSAYYFVCLKGPAPGAAYQLHSNVITLGRQSDNLVVANDHKVSRHHAELVWRGSGYVLRDLNSANGTFVNKARVLAPVTLQVGDKISLGQDVCLLFTDQPNDGSRTLVEPQGVAGAGAAGLAPVAPSLPPPVPPVQAANSVQPAARKRRHSCLIAGLLGLAILFCMCLFTTLSYMGAVEYLAAPKIINDIAVPDMAVARYTLSPDQRGYVDKIGYPDSFIILFYDAEDGDQSPTRLETWIYSLQGRQITFVNGELDTEEDIPSPGGELFAAPYKPEQFTAYMNLDELLAATQLDELMVLPLERELVDGGESFFADQVSFGMKDDELRYVEAIGLAYVPDDGGEADSGGAVAAVPEPAVAPEEKDGPKPPVPVSEPTAEPVGGGFSNNFVFSSDRDDSNFPVCNEDDDLDCSLQVFYVPDIDAASVKSSAVDLTQGFGFREAYSPDLAPDRSRVAFAGCMGDDTCDIYVVNVDGTGLLQLTTDPADDRNPSWSPDGSRIVFMSGRTGGSKLFIVDVETGVVSQLAGGESLDRYPDWSPDGNLVAFHSNRDDPDPANCWPNCNWEIYTVDVNTEQLVRWTDNPAQDGTPAWSPDGELIAFNSNRNGNYDIYLVDTYGNETRLSDDPGDETNPAWSPDGARIAFVSTTSTGYDIAITPVGGYDPVFYTGLNSLDIYPDW